MFDNLYAWLGTILFLTGTLFGGLMYFLFQREKNKNIASAFNESEQERAQLQNQLFEKSKIVNEFDNLSAELTSVKKDNQTLASNYEKVHSSLNALKVQADLFDNAKTEKLNLKNRALKDKIRKLKNKPSVKTTGKDYLSHYQNFLKELDYTIQRAKKDAFRTSKKKKKKSIDKGKLTKASSSKKDQKRKKQSAAQKEKLAFYSKKFKTGKTKKAKSKFLSDLQRKDSSSERDLTFLHGITPAIQKVLNKEKIYSFSDLSRTKISSLRAILAKNGNQFSKINPLNWPIQARIAEKGHWDILKEYKEKMDPRRKPK